MAARVLPPDARVRATIHECRTCPASTRDLAGWFVIGNIDGPSTMCPTCGEQPKTCLSVFAEEYPDAKVVARYCPTCRVSVGLRRDGSLRAHQTAEVGRCSPDRGKP